MNILTAEQDFKAAEKRRERLKSISDKITFSDGVLTIDIEYPYDIEEERINTPDKLLHWLLHLSHKTWVTKDVLYILILNVSEHFGFKIHDRI